VEGPNYQDRIERNYHVAVSGPAIGSLWRDLSEYLPKYGLLPTYTITCVGSVYFDNKDFDLTRYAILNGGRHILVRLRSYENYGESPKPIAHYWVEVKTRHLERWRKKRFKLKRSNLAGFLNGENLPEHAIDFDNGAGADAVRQLYAETQETILTTGIVPMLLLTYRRVAFQGEIERVCLDSDIQYYHVDSDVYSYPSWKYPLQEPAGRSEKTILEIKHPAGRLPDWITDLENRYPIGRTNFSKYVEGMGFLFRGPLRNHTEADYFIPRIETYMTNSERL
jgi:SPX domain protein involved in polyphosphate accumulation